MTNKSKKEKGKYYVPAVDVAFKILTLLSRKKFANSTLTEIATALSITPTSCYRILQQLEALSIVRFQRSTKQYSLGPYLVVLGDRAKENIFDITVMLPYLEDLTEQTGLTSALINRIGEDQTTIIAKVEGDDFGVNVSVGRHFSIVDGSYGKCFLAYMEEEKARELLTVAQGLREISEKERDEIIRELPLIRQQGYATAYGEYIHGIFGVAAPVFNSEQNVETVICFFGVTAQFNKSALDELAIRIKQAAKSINKKIAGY